MKRFAFILMLSLFLMGACAPANKEAYLADYKAFMDRVADERKEYGDAQWEKAKLEFNLYSDKWYNKFEKELTVKEQLIIAGYEAKFAYFYAAHETGEAIGDALRSLRKADKKGLKATIQDYLENDLTDDLEDLYREAEEIGGETLELVEDIFDELDVKL